MKGYTLEIPSGVCLSVLWSRNCPMLCRVSGSTAVKGWCWDRAGVDNLSTTTHASTPHSHTRASDRCTHHKSVYVVVDVVCLG